MRLLHENDESRLNAVRRVRRTTVLAILVFGISLAATGWAWRANRAQARERARTRLQQEIDRTRANLRTRLVVYEDALYGTRSLFEANGAVTRSMFRDYVTNLKLGERYPGIQGIGYAQCVQPQHKAEHTARVRAEGYPEYNIRPEGERAEYTSIIYLEPFDWRNQRAFGYDMFSEPTRHAAMSRARDTGAVAMTGKVTLLQETSKNVQAGFLMYLPLYRQDLPHGTPDERRTALLGYIYSPFRMGDLMSELPPENPQLAGFEVFSGYGTNSDSLMYRDPAKQSQSANYSPALTQLTHIDFGGQSWTVRFTSSPSFDAVVRENENGFLLPAGIAISLLLSGIILSLARTRQRAVQLADIITARLRESEAHVIKLNQELTDALFRSEKLAITGRLMATIAHEINNPLAALTNVLFVLESENLSPASKDYVRMAKDQVAMLTNISRQTLTPYREARFPTVSNVSELLDDVLSMLRPRLLGAKIHVVRYYPALVEVTLYASELRQVFTNLVANAIDAMPRGGQLTVTVTSSENNVCISVTDTGMGIAPEHRGKLFEPFFTTKGEHGTGVGLWVVKEIITRVGGHIELTTSSDAEDHGTTFTVSLPATAQRPAKEHPAQEDVPEKSKPAVQS